MRKQIRWYTEVTLLSCLCGLSPLMAAAGDPAELRIQATPGSATPEIVARKWDEAVGIEGKVFQDADEHEADSAQLTEQLAHAADLFAFVGDAEGGRTQGYWRAARASWLSGDTRPLDDVTSRVNRFEHALVLADRGLETNPDCAECMLWKFNSMGRLRTTQSVWKGIRQVRDMARLLDRAIALNPTHRDSEDNSTLANLHEASAIFYRLVPESFWVRLLLGVKGDKERALEHSQTALSLHPRRLDYRIEVATQLLCLGSARGDDARLAEGKARMLGAIRHGATSRDQEREFYFARLMLDTPDKACGYSGDKVLEMDKEEARRAIQ